MFNHLPTFVKFIIVLCGGLLAYWLGGLMLQSILLQSDPLVEIGLSFVLCWIIIGFSWLFFQTFKFFRFHSDYYRIRRFENLRLYSVLLTKQFQTVLVNSFFKYLNKRVYLKGRKRDYIKVYYTETKQAETSHVFSIVITLVPTVICYLNQQWLAFTMLILYSILFNVYPIFLQRKNRIILLKRFKSLLLEP